MDQASFVGEDYVLERRFVSYWENSDISELVNGQGNTQRRLCKQD